MGRVTNLAKPICAAGWASGAVGREALETIVLLIGPMMPHLAETCWEALGHKTMIVQSPWPKADPVYLKSDTITMAVQVNGKRRGEIVVAADSGDDTAKESALALEPVKRALDGKAPKRVIVVPGRIVNIVA